MPRNPKPRKPTTRADRKWALAFIAALDIERDRIRGDVRSSAAYWNGDDWGSISGFRDAEEWQRNKLADWILKNLPPTRSRKR